MPVIVIYNPVSGDRTAKAFFDDHVLPLLKQRGVDVDKVVPTESSGHAGKIVVDLLTSTNADWSHPLSIVLGSGDGTLHELINTLNTFSDARPLRRVNIALVPAGTANALYASFFPSSPEDDPVQYKLKSVEAFVSGNYRSVPLNLAVNVLSSHPTPLSANKDLKHMSISAVVASTALHASILHDSEALRATDPSIGRFKTAAMQNITRWYGASVKLFPHKGPGVVEVYDPATLTFVPFEGSTVDEPIVDLEGPFAYFLSTINVDRLEPQFKITPRAKDVLEKGTVAALDVIIVRPMRDPSYTVNSEERRQVFAEKAGAVLGAAYQDGAHITLRYAHDGRVVAEGSGPTVVEYLRCGGWEWEPDDADERAHLVCADGDILTIPMGGKASCTAVAPIDDETGFALYV
ncbi:ATP-NAD kinase-like domain-containing protein [Trametes meyenii]|nr:ATP-NAD kinase-like domain-containing protein [Trametes meyenii]